MASLTHLNAVLADVLNTGVAADEQELFDLLLTYRPSLVKVLDVGGQSESERKELQGGKITVDKRQMSINADFATQAIFVGSTLECSELYVAGLMQHVISRNPNISPPEIVERVVLEHHARRRQAVDCLQLLLSAALSPLQTPLVAQLEQFVQQQLLPGLGAKLWTEIERLEQIISRATTAATNAGSTTDVQGNNIRLGQDVLLARQQSLVHERRELAVDLYLVARLGRLSPQELEKMVLWLQQQPKHALTLYVLSSLLAFFDVVDPASPGAVARQKLSTTPAILNLMKTRLAPSAEWKEPGLKAVLLLKWTLFLAELRRRDASLEHKDGFQTEQLETNVWNAVQGDAFAYLSAALASADPEPPSNDFKPELLSSLESLARLVITHASSELRKIKQRQEDHMFASVRADRARTFRSASSSTAPPKPSPPPRNDIAAFFNFLGTLYTSLPSERALQFWGSVPLSPSLSYAEQTEAAAGKLPAFLQWSVWSTQPSDAEMCTALFSMLSGLSHGRQSAELAYNFHARGTGEVLPGAAPASGKQETIASWAWMLRLLEAWVTPVPSARGSQSQMHGHSGFGGNAQPAQQSFQPLSPKEVFLGQAVLRLLSTVATHAPGPRLALTSNTHLHVLQTLTSLLPLNCALELKGSALSALSALCAPGGGAEAARNVWGLLERLEVVNVRGGGPIIKKGVQSALELVEEPNGVYPQTIPFILLLASLVHTPKQRPLRAVIADVDGSEGKTIPDGLGSGYRVAGLGPYVGFVVEEVFLRIPGREYKDARERWRMNDACLSFIENCLAAFDLSALVSAADAGTARPEMIPPLLSHPGCDVLQRLLTRSNLLANILSYAVDGVDGFDRGLDRAEVLFARTIERVLRILVRAVELQTAFLDVLIPLAHALPPSPLSATVQPRNHYTPLDAALGFSAPLAPAIAAYVAHAPAHPEAALLALRILNALSRSAVFPARNLATMVERSAESERVVGGFRRLLEVDARVAPESAMEVAERYAGAGAPDAQEEGEGEEARESVLQAARLSALDMLVEHTRPGAVYPTLSHLVLLGSTAQGADAIQDPRALGAKKAGVHVLLEMLGAGVGKGRRGREVLLVSQPEIAEKMYTIILNLCTHPRTSDATTRYLRTHEDFFARQLSALPPRAPETQDPGVEVVYGDGVRVRTVVSSLAAFLRGRAAVCELAALDGHVLARRGHHKALNALLGVFFGNAEDEDEEDAPGAEDWQDEIFGSGSGGGGGRVGGQRSVRAVEMVQSLSFDWVNALSVEPRNLELLGGLDLVGCTREDNNGCALLDRDVLLSTLAGARRALSSGKGGGQVDERRLSAETAYVLQSAVVENQRRVVAHAQSAGFEAWAKMLRTSIAHLPAGETTNEVLLADVLHEIPPLLLSGAVPEECAVVLAECAGAIVGRLRVDKGVEGLSRERMLGTLGSLVECALQNRTEVVRGNVYAALVNYLHIVAPSSSSSITGSSSLSLSTLGSSTSLVLGSSTRGSGPSQSDNALQSLRPVLERLVVSVARDASAGTEVWRTVAFTLLARLVALDGAVLNVLSKHGFVQGFVYALKEADGRLVGVLKPDPDDLNALYVYEAQMGLLMRVAGTRAGAERLLDAGLLSTLAGCDFIDAQPEADHAFIDRDAFLPSAIQRYHQLLLPALQLTTQLHATLTPHTAATKQTLHFLTSHADTLSILLKSPPSSLAALYEQRLVVELCRSVLPGVEGRERMAEHTGFGGLNGAVMALAARALAGGVGEGVSPISDTEVADNRVLAPGYAQISKFALAVRDAGHALERALLLYLASASDPGEDSTAGITLVVAPVVGPPRSADSRVVATVPTMGDLLDALAALSSELNDTLRNSSNISHELSAQSHLRIEDYLPILPPSLSALAASQSPSQTRSMIAEELGRIKERIVKRAEGLLEGVEVALLVAWTHAGIYASENSDSSDAHSSSLRRPVKERTGINIGSAALARAMAGAPKGHAFVRDAARRAGNALGKVDVLELGVEEGWRDREAFVRLLSGRLAEVLGLVRVGDGEE